MKKSALLFSILLLFASHSALAQSTLSGKRIQAGTLPISGINATGTASSSTYLRGDGSWSTPSSGGFPWESSGATLTSAPTAINITGGGETFTASGSALTLTIPGYTLPAATSSAIGGVRPDNTTITVAGGVLSAAAQTPTLAGDVTGASNANTVVKIKGRTVTTTTSANGQELVDSGSGLVPAVRSGLTSVKVVDTVNAATAATAGATSGSSTASPLTIAGAATAAVNGSYVKAAGTDSNGNPYWQFGAIYLYYFSGPGYWVIGTTLDSTNSATFYYLNPGSGQISSGATLGTYSSNGSLGSNSAFPTVSAPAIAPTATIDGYALTSGDRVLLSGQTTGSQNGVWVYNGASSSYSRPADYPTGQPVQPGAYVECSGGSTRANTFWSLQGQAQITVDTTATSWVSAGDGGGTVSGAVVSAAAYAVVANVDRFLIANAGSNSIVFSLPDPTSYSGPEIDLTRNDTSSAYTVTVVSAGTGKSVVNASSVVAQYQVRHFIRLADGSGWLGY